MLHSQRTESGLRSPELPKTASLETAGMHAGLFLCAPEVLIFYRTLYDLTVVVLHRSVLQSSAYPDGLDPADSSAAMVAGGNPSMEALMSRLPPNVQRSLAHPQLSSLLQATLAGSATCRTGQPAPFPESPAINSAVLQNLGRPLDSHPKSQAFYAERPGDASQAQTCAPTIEEQIHALPRHLLDSDSDSECPTPHPGAHYNASPNPRPPGTPSINSDSHRGPLPRQILQPFSNLSLHSARAEPSSLSIDAAPFVPRTVAGLGAGVRSTQDLLAALMQAVSCDHLAGLLMEHARLLDSTCIVAAMQRLVQLDATGMQHANSVHDVAMRIASLATLHHLPPPATACLLTDLLVIKAPLAAPPTFALVAAASEQLELAPSMPLLVPVATALQRLQHGVSEALLPGPCSRVGRAASALLLQGRLADVSAEAVPALAFALRVGNVTAPDVITVFGHAACMHANTLATTDIITALQILVASHVTDSGMLNMLARAFHDRAQVCPTSPSPLLHPCIRADIPV